MQTSLREAKRKQKWMIFSRIYTHRLACQRNNLPCTPSILKHHVSLGHKWISRGFTLTRYLGKGSVPSIYEKPKDSLDTYYPRNEGKLANWFFPRNVLWMKLWNISIQNPPRPPPQKKIEQDGPIFKVLSRSTKTCQAQINNKSSTAKLIFFRGQRNITWQNALFPNVYRTFLRKKLICPESSLNNIKAG